MSEDEPAEEQAANKRDSSVDREEREHRRKSEGRDDTGGSPSGETNVEDSPNNSDQSANDGTEGVNEVAIEREEEQLDVPQIRIDHSSQLRTTEQIEETPSDDTPVEVPQLQLSPTALVDPERMEESIPIEQGNGNVPLPQFVTDTVNWLTPKELDDDTLEGIERAEQVQIPQVTVNDQHRIRPFETFLTTVPEVTEQPSEVEAQTGTGESADEKEAAEPIEPSELEPSALDQAGVGDDWIAGEWPDPLELLFGPGGTEIKSDNPVVVQVAEDDLVGVVETLMKRLYREKVGGEPDLQKFNTADQLADEERWMSADGRIFTAELPDDEWQIIEKEAEYQDEWRSIWQNRFDQLFSGQQFGAIIFNRSQVPDPEVTSLPHHPPNSMELERRIAWKDVAGVFWTSEPANARRSITFSQLFDRDADGVAQDRWEQILEAADGKFKFATKEDDTESNEHNDLKVFIVKWLSEQLWKENQEFTEYDNPTEVMDYREIERTIPTEEPVSVVDGSPVKPDVKYRSRIFEAEMFFEEADGSGIVSKLQRTVRKYEGAEQQIDEINIVVDNLTCLLHLHDLAKFKRTHRFWEEDYADITLFTVDLEQEELIPLGEIVERIASLSTQ